MNGCYKKILNALFASFVVASILLSTGCATTSAISKARHHQVYRKLTAKDRNRIAETAHKSIGKSSIKAGQRAFRADCSGTVRGIFAQARVPLGGVMKSRADNDVKAIYRYVRKYGQIIKSKPQPGDLVFFHNTYDRSRNGRLNDALTHIGIVEKIEGSLVHFVHHLGRSIIRSRMDLSMPTKSINPATNKRVNHMLRRAQGPHPSFTTGQLFAGFGRL